MTVRTFELDHRLPSSFVDKALVEMLEDYLEEHLAPRRDVSDQDRLFIEMTHSAGRVTLDSISHDPRSRFTEGTEEIAIVCRVDRPQPLHVRVQFSVNRRDSFVRVRYTSDESREFLLSLVGGIERMILARRTWNSWFCPDIHVAELLDGLAVGVVVFAIYAFTAGSRVPRWMIVTSVLLPFYRLVGLFKPYTAFETPQTEVVRTVANWLTAGLAGFGALLTLGAYFDIAWLGF